MANYVLSCCSTADLSKEHFQSRDIHYVCFHYAMNGKEYLDDLGESMSFEDFYKAMADGADTRTSQVNISEYVEFFSKFLEQGLDVVHVCLSSGISGTINSARNAALVVKERFPERNVYIFSTDLTSYVRGGRISKTAAVFGGLLEICPLLNMDNLGRLIPRSKIRTKKRVIKEIVSRMEQHAQDGHDYSGKCYISNSACYDDARAVADLVEEKFPKLNGKVEINHVGTTIGSHTGPGTVALFFWGDERTE